MRLNYFYDTEFIDTGGLIKFISIGVVCEDGREYYAVNADVDDAEVRDDPWHGGNTWPHLPTVKHGEFGRVVLDRSDPVVKPRVTIRDELYVFLLPVARIRPRLWAWFDAHDFLVLSQLWGPLHDLPRGLPQHGYDLKQEFDRQRLAPRDGVAVTRPPAPRDAHHALADAYWNLELAYRLGIVPRRGLFTASRP